MRPSRDLRAPQSSSVRNEIATPELFQPITAISCCQAHYRLSGRLSHIYLGTLRQSCR